MTNHAVVQTLAEDGLAVVEVKRAAACGESCALCGQCGKDAAKARLVVRNPVGAQCGDAVEVMLPSARALSVAALVFIVPVLLLAAGLAYSLWLGCAGFVFGLLLAVGIDKRMTKRTSAAVIVRIFSKDGAPDAPR